MTHVTATVPTANGGKYVRQLCKHWAHKLDVTPVEFRLFQYLFEHPGRVYSRSQLLDCIYTDGRIVTDRVVDSHIKNLRRKLNEAMPEQELIQSIYGIGYKLDF